MTLFHQKTHTQTPKIVTPCTVEAQRLNPLSFGIFLPPLFRTTV